MAHVVIRPPTAQRIDAYNVALKYASDVLTGRIVAGKLLKLAAKRFISDLKVGPDRGIIFDKQAAQHVVDFFSTLHHSKGEWGPRPGCRLGDPFMLSPWQVFILANLFGFKLASNGFRRFRRAHIEVARKNGKALALDTPTPTPTGWRMFGDLEIGDEVFDERGAVQKVMACTEVMHDHPCYRITFDDDSSIVADAGHKWLVESCVHDNGTRGKKRKREDNIRTTEELSARIKVGNEWNHKLLLPAALQYAERQQFNAGFDKFSSEIYNHDALLMHPYAMGTWLGDGDSAGAVLTCFDSEILTHLREVGVTVIPKKVVGRYQLGDYGCFITALRKEGVLHNKHIPKKYLTASIEQRLELLRGLMDTDGSISKVGCCEFTTTSSLLALGVQELLRSLGYAGRIDADRATLEGRDCGPKYRIQFWPRTGERVFNLSRKALRQRPLKGTRTRKISIVSIEPTKSVPVRCIQVSGPSHLFLVGKSMVPTHNSTFMAGIALYMLAYDGEPGAECYAIATRKDQAREVFDEAVRMAQKTMSNKVHFSGGKLPTNISILGTASKFQVQASDYGTADGKNVHFLCADELHQHPSRLLWDAYSQAVGSRRQPMLIGITTAGYDTTGICYQQRNIGSNVLSPSSLEEVIAGDSFFAYIACIDEPDKEGKNGDDPFNETCWIKANPNLGVSVKLDDLRVEAGLAKIDASALNSFLCKKLNVWVNQEFRWMDPSRWAQCSAAGTLANPKELRAAAIKKLQGRMAIGGLDLSEKFDLSAFALVFPPVVAKIERVPRPQTREQIMFRVPIVYDEVEMEPADPNWSVLVWFWVPKDKIQERVKKDRVMYDVWARDEYLMTCPGSVIDHEVILKHIVELKDKFAVRDIGYDEWNAAWISKKLDESGFTTVKVPMTYGRMSEPMKNLMAAVLEHKLEHYGDPILSWNAGNVSATTNVNGDIRPDKEKSKEKIDGIVAIIMALSLVCANPKLADDRGGAWDYSRGIVFI